MVATAAPAVPAPPSTRPGLREVAACTAAGALVGFLVGGVLGRLAMFVLRLTSKDGVRGLSTDDQFEIGAFSTETIFLLAVGAGIGAVGGLVYGGLRRYLPARRVALGALFGATVGGSFIIHPGGVDFTFLDPLALAVAMFVAIPAVGLAGIVALGERFVASSWWGTRRVRTGLTLVPAITLVPLAPASVPAAAVAALAVWGARRGLADDQRVRTGLTAVLLVWCLVAFVALVRDVVEIL